MSHKPPVLFIMGPTASGKTDLALQLFDHQQVEIISVDSALIYKGMDIGTAKPDHETLSRYPHALVDILDPIESFSASEFVEQATRLINVAHSKGKLPVLVGGTILYFKALAEGLATMPKANPALRREIERQAEQEGWPALHEKLSKLDPASGRRLKPLDQQRIQRALEVVLSTGKSIETFWHEQTSKEHPWEIIPLALMPKDRSWLHKRIEQRFDLMIAEGFQHEVERLRARGDLHLDLPSVRCVGYRQMWQYLDGDYDWEAMKFKSVVATRQLAKRQMTWLRGWQNATVLDPEDQNIFDKTLALINTI